MINPLESIEIRVGNSSDQDAITEFALAISEDPVPMRNKWSQETNDPAIYPVLAVYNENIVGRIQARIHDGYGWLEEARIVPKFRRKGIAHTLVDAAMDWLISSGVRTVRTIVDSDNLSARLILERHHFSPKFLAINPSTRVTPEDVDPMEASTYAPLLDTEFYEQIYSKVTNQFGPDVMVDGRYVVLNRKLFELLIEQRRIYVDHVLSSVLIMSSHNLPSEFQGFLVADKMSAYKQGGLALKAFANRELTTSAVCHAPASREAVVGLAQAEFGWGQPYSIIVYERGSWQQREDK